MAPNAWQWQRDTWSATTRRRPSESLHRPWNYTSRPHVQTGRRDQQQLRVLAFHSSGGGRQSEEPRDGIETRSANLEGVARRIIVIESGRKTPASVDRHIDLVLVQTTAARIWPVCHFRLRHPSVRHPERLLQPRDASGPGTERPEFRDRHRIRSRTASPNAARPSGHPMHESLLRVRMAAREFHQLRIGRGLKERGWTVELA